MIEYIKAQNKTNDVVLNNEFNQDELHRFSKADFRWANNRATSYQTRKVKKGEIYQFEFGKNFLPEMSYEHRGLIIGVKKRLLYVLPIFSYDSRKHTDVYHPVDYPNSKSDLYLLKKNEFDCIKHDSVLKLNDIRTVSINRILYKHEGNIESTTDTYKRIETLVLKKYFAEFYYEFENNKKEIDVLKKDNAKLEEENKLYKETIGPIQEEGKMCKALDDLYNDGIERGIEQGEDRKLMVQVQKKLQKGYTIPEIAEMLEESEGTIKKVVNKTTCRM